jgi:hypothetical protein
MSYYQCKRCNKFKTKYKQNMIIHINRTKKCPKIMESYSYTDEELYNMSLELIICDSYKTYDKDDLLCIHCNKYFSRKDNLYKHQKRYHNDIINNDVINNDAINNDVINNDVINNNNIINIINNNNNNNNNIINNNNININKVVLQPFDDNWNIDHINKYLIFLSLKKYTTFLDKVLEKDENLNVIIDNNSDSGLVYKNEKEQYVNMKKKEIFSITMEKINKQLCEMFDEVLKDENILGNDAINYLNKQKIEANIKYDDYVGKDNVKKDANIYIEELFSKKKDNALDVLLTNNKNIGY